MKKIIILGTLIVAVALVAGFGCGGGGSSSATSTTATVTMSSGGTLANGTQIGALDVTLTFPAGVSVKTSPAKVSKSNVTYTGVVSATGVAAGTNSMALATQTAANTLDIKVANPVGFGTGEFVQVTFDIAAGSTIKDTDFVEGTLTAADLNGVPIPGLTAVASTVLQ